MTTTRLIIARHGNTFNSGEPPRRVGAHTDLPLVESGRAQAQALGKHLKEQGLIPDLCFSSQQRRAIETAELALDAMDRRLKPTPLAALNELDYGPDENQTEDRVVARIGAQALKDWDERALVPPGWKIDSETLKNFWLEFSGSLVEKQPGKTILVVTSNGTARFAPHITGSYESFSARFSLKLATGAYGIINHDDKTWQGICWNVRPVA
ncbi:MAG: histidine phosphatase family protein [Micavibrio aeruginosavorus]|uniref:phosphoglycerate mutase (2,3-diphosphoglycerate-dependent) n=1 Tax=Micavibrio aeruginosavorus TaxID=349221 RepID=A0A7T5R1P3_9BACT|nr:MAG: histidine phosphatase family protein [Micavibrio aeruginosavorus]